MAGCKFMPPFEYKNDEEVQKTWGDLVITPIQNEIERCKKENTKINGEQVAQEILRNIQNKYDSIKQKETIPNFTEFLADPVDNANGLKGSINYTMVRAIYRSKSQGFDKICKYIFSVLNTEINKYYGLEKSAEKAVENKVVQELREVDSRDPLVKYFSGAVTAKNQFLSRMMVDFIEMTFINFSTLARIKNDLDLNNAIAKYKQDQYYNICKCLNLATTYKQSAMPALFPSSTTVNTKALNLVLKEARSFLEKMDMFNESTLRQAYKHRNEEKRLGLLVKVFESYILLQEDIFDQLLAENNPNISIMRTNGLIQPKQKNVNGNIVFKYHFGTKNNYYKGWGDTDIDATKLMGNIASMLITKTPILDPDTGSQVRKDFMTKERFFKITNLLKDPQVINAITNPEIRELLRNAHKNPIANYIKAMQLLIENWDTEKEAFPANAQLEGKRILYSIYKRLFAINGKGETPSIYQVDLQEIQSNPLHKSFLLIESVLGAIDRTADSSYTSYSYNKKSGNLAPNEIQKNVNDGYEIDLSLSWDIDNAQRFTVDDRVNIINTHGVETVSNSKRLESNQKVITFFLSISDGKTYYFKYDFSKTPTLTYTEDPNLDLKSKDWKSVEIPSKHDLVEAIKDPTTIASDKVRCFYELLRFADQLMFTSFSDQTQYDLIETLYTNNGDRFFMPLFTLAMNAARNHITYIAYDSYKKQPNAEPLSINEFVNNPDITLSQGIYYKGDPYYRYNQGVLDYKNKRLRVFNSSTNQTIRSWISQAQQEITGEFYKASLRNSIGNAIPVNKMANLAAMLPFQIQERIINNKDSALKANLFATNFAQLLGNTTKDGLNITTGLKKSTSDFTESEHAISSILYDFYGRLSSGFKKTKVKDGATSYSVVERTPIPKTFAEFTNQTEHQYVTIQPTTYSDKVTIYLFKAGNRYWIKDTATKVTPGILEEFLHKKGLKDNLKKLQDACKDIKNVEDLTVKQQEDILEEHNEGFCVDLTMSDDETIIRAINLTIGAQYREIFRKVLADYRYNLTNALLTTVITSSEAQKSPIIQSIVKKVNNDWVKNASLSLLLTDSELLEVMKYIKKSEYQKIAFTKYISNAEKTYLTKTEDNFINADNILTTTEDTELDTFYKTRLMHHFRCVLTNDVIESLLDYAPEDISNAIGEIRKDKPKAILSTILSDEQIVRLVNLMSVEQYTEIAEVDHSSVIEELHITKTSPGVVPNKLLTYYATTLFTDGNLLLNASFKSRLAQEQHKFLKNLVQYNVQFDLDTDGVPNSSVYQAIDSLPEYSGKPGHVKYIESWVNPYTRRLYLAKKRAIVDGKPGYVPASENDIRDITTETLKGGEFILNPILSKFFLSDYLLSENMRLASTGASFVHKDTHETDEDPLMNAIKEAASREGAQYKRQVIIPGTLQYFLQKSIIGVPPTMNIAILSDAQAATYNIAGEANTKNDAHDGSGFDHPCWGIQQNLSLQDQAVGEDKKNIMHTLSVYGVAELQKYAVFGMYNERMRQSRLSPNSFYNLVKNMSSLDWEEAYDLNVDLYGNRYKNMLNMLKPSALYFRGRGGRHYEVTGLYLEDASNFTYKRYVREVDNDGNVKEQFEPQYITIKNLWDLMEALGGIYSEDLVNGKFIYGNTNIVTTVNYINNIGKYTGETITSEISGLLVPKSIPTQDETYQPLKTCYIHTATNGSGFKNSAQYKNGKEAWKDGTKLFYITSDTYNIGPQMDADHIVVDGEHGSQVTEPSQIIAALEANGFTHEIAKEAYIDLGKVAMAAIAKYDQATKDYIASGYNIDAKHALYHQLGTLIYKEILKDSSEVSTSTAVMSLIEQTFNIKGNHKNDTIKIPFSDPNIFSKSIATFVSNLNKTAIKRKFQGEGAVMVPAYDIMTYFYVPDESGNYHQYMLDDVQKRACGKYPNLEIMEAVSRWLIDAQDEEDRHPKTMDKLLPGDKVVVKFADGTTQNYDLEDYDQYLALKGLSVGSYSMEHSLKGATFTYAIVNRETGEAVTRNLRPQETTWTVTTNGETRQYNLYDLYDVREAIKIRRAGVSKKAVKEAAKALDKAKASLKTKKRGTAQWDEAYEKVIVSNNKYKQTLQFAKTEDLQCQQNINNALKKLHEGKMCVAKGEYVNIDKGSLKTKAAELIMSKIYAQQLGLKEGDSLADILENETYFEDQICTTPSSLAYDVCYLTDSGNHLYITTSVKPGMIENTHLTQNNRYDFITDDKHRRYRVDAEGNYMYLVGESLPQEVTDEKSNKKTQYVYTQYIDFYVDANGNEVLCIKDPKHAANLFKHSQYTGVQFNPTFTNQEFINGLFSQWEQRRYLQDYRTAVGTPQAGESLHQITKNYLEARKKEDANKKKVSFLAALDYTVGRIPAQAQQSFMQMRCVAFLNTNKNVVHVSHYQTWLQGSDYDIDKAYIIGNEFNHNGIYVGWSPFFDYSSEETLNKSMLLPTPNGNTYTWSKDKKAVNITDVMIPFAQEPVSIDAYINLLQKVDGLTSIKYNRGVINEATSQKVLAIINKHNNYFIENPRLTASAFKNSVSSKMRRVVSDVRNALISYTPIGMEEPREAADSSQSGEAVKTMTGMDPFTKWIMTVQNMSGKKVIGIAATGEKIFFALSYYYNELVSTNDPEWFKNAFFQKVLYKLNITDPINQKGHLEKLYRNAIDNINFYGNEKMQKLWEETVTAYLKNELNEVELENVLEKQFNLRPDQSLVISALLSAATDNAKELILDKINAGPDFAGLYLHMIIMGVDFQDIAELMTSPTMNSLKELLQTNAFSNYNFTTGNAFNRAIALAKQGPVLAQYYIKDMQEFLTKTSAPETVLKAIEQHYKKCKLLELEEEIAADKLKEGKYDEGKYDEEKANIENTQALQAWQIADFLRNNFQLFARYYHKVGDINLYTKTEQQGEETVQKSFPVWGKTAEVNRFIEDYNRTLSIVNRMDPEVFNAIEDLHEQASITTTLGQAVLSSNQGFETDFPGKLKRLQKLENIMFDAEKKNLTNDLRNNIFGEESARKDAIARFAQKVQKRNITLSEEEISKALDDAIRYDIFDGGFSIELFLTDENYRQVAIRYYTLIKDSYNIYDVIDKVPHFNAIFKVYNIILTVDNNFSRKFKYARAIIKRMVDTNMHSPYFTEDELTKLTSSIDTHFMGEWLASKNIRIPIGKGCEYFDNQGKRHPVEEGQTYMIDLSTDEGCATFKLYMETHFMRSLANGWIPGIGQYLALQQNALVRQIKSSEFEDKASGVSIPYLKAPINMLRHDSYSDSSKYEAIQIALQDLQKVTAYDKLSVADFLFLYNLIVNHNRYGAQQLTALFGKVLSNSNSLAYQYNHALGELDYQCDDRSIEMNLQDILMDMAPLCGEKTADRQGTPYIRVKTQGKETTTLMKRIQGGIKGTRVDDDSDVALEEEDWKNSVLSELDEEFSVRKAVNIKNYVGDNTGGINSKDIDYWRYFTLRRPFMTDLTNALRISDADIVDALKSTSHAEFVHKITQMIKRNSILTDLICNG